MTPQMSIAITGKNMTGPAFAQVTSDAQRAANAVNDNGARMGAAMHDASFQTANLAAQFNDIGVMLASGQSPLILAIQQGTQISQVLGPMGAGQAVNALKTALLSLLSPVTLITIGTIAAGAALFQWLTSANDELPKANEAMEEHAAAIRKAGEAYGYAEGELESYAQRSQEVAVANLRRSNEAIAAALRAASAELTDSLSGDAPTMVDGIVEMVRRAKDEYSEFEPIILSFLANLENGTADFEAFNRQVAAVGANRPELQDVADEIILLAEKAYDLWGAGKAGADGIDALGDAASRNIGQMRAMAGAFGELAGIALPNLDDRENAAQQRDLIMNNGTASPSDRIKAAKAYADAIARVDTREAEEEAIRLAREGASAADSQAEAYNRVIETLTFEAELVGVSAREQEVLNNVRAAGVDIASEQGTAIRAMTEELYDQQEALKQVEDEQRALEEAMEDYGRIGKAAVRGVIDALMDGKIEANEFGSILSSIGSSLLNMGLDGLFGGFGGGGKKGGFLGGIFGFSEGGGGIVGGGGGYAPGAADDTLFVAKAQKGEPFAFGQEALDGLAPRSQSRGSLTLNLSGLGLSAEAVGQLVNDAIDRFDRMSLPGRVQAINADPLARG